MKDALVIIVVRRASTVVNDQGACAADGLYIDVGVVEVSAGVIIVGCNLIVEEVPWRNRPLRGERRSISEGGHSLCQAMPMLVSWSAYAHQGGELPEIHHGQVLIRHIIVNPDPTARPRQDVKSGAWRRSVDEDICSTLA